ncbi:MAG: hypothetical protein L0Z50_27985 [Verrucomicrobiales bacterium]|nr:hypothetical protein [Verrucomicrobiales bacterium]
MIAIIGWSRSLLVPIALALIAGSAVAQHAHINAGAFSTAQDAQLYFVNGANFVTNSGYILPLTLTTNAPYHGLYRGSVTFTSLPATLSTGGPAFGHAAFGAFLQLEVVNLRGPRDGVFGLWQQNEDTGDTSLQFTVPVGTQEGTNLFALTESDASPGSDPYGHIHGRQFTASLPGLYTVGFRIVDTSTNGTDGGPIHKPSEIFNLYLQAGLTIAALTKTNTEATVVFAALPGNLFLEGTTNLLDASSWKTAAGPLTTTRTELRSLVDPSAAGPIKFYRLRMDGL